MVKKYGQTVLVTQDLALENYLEKCVDVTFYYGRRADAEDAESPTGY